MKTAESELIDKVSPAYSHPPSDLALGPDEIHIWWANLDLLVSQFYRFTRILSIDERMRADGFYFEKDKKRFIIRHGILRMILGYYLGVEPNEIRFCYGRNKKPRFIDTFGSDTFRFSMSSSGELALYGFTRNREIGVDVERVRDIPEMDEIAKLIFSPRQTQIYQALPKRLKREAFFACWTRKEAFVKATGDGLSRGLDKFELTVNPGEPARLLEIDVDLMTASGWSIQDLRLPIELAAAIAAEGRSWRLRCLRWADYNPAQANTYDMHSM